jgi:iron complex outermembrane receptor protein
MSRNLLLMCIMAFSSFAYSQTGTITGRVLDPDTDEALIGANVIIEGTTTGATTDIDGYFKMVNVNAGSYNLIVTYIGYDAITVTANVTAGSTTDIGTVTLETNSIGLKEIEVIASMAIDRKTPVAVSTVKGDYIEEKLGSQEFPEILKGTPGVYVTKAGGGYGDGRINIRGFDSQNVAVMINGVPVNDMENGRVYWSNWAGLADVTGSMQVQRGLGAAKVAVPSVGGTINIVSKATDAQRGGSFFVGVGNNLYNKLGLSLSTGMSEKGWAMTLQGARTEGAGYVNGTEFLGWSYYLNIAKKVNNNHLLTFSVIGAQQRHGQRQNRLAVERFVNSPNGIRQNDDWGKLGGEVVHVEDNFYHKPQIALNHYWTISQNTELATTVYASFGSGGGGGQAGDGNLFDLRTGSGGRDYGYIDLDAIVSLNEEAASNGEEAISFLRASRNDHKWFGVLSVLTQEFGSNFTLSGGLDYRYYRGSHFREVTNLLGADFVISNSNVNKPNDVIGVGDKFSYNNDGIVNWIGIFAQGEYTLNDLSVFASATVSNSNYKREDYFGYAPEDQLSDAYNFLGYIFKGGANYNIGDHHNVFFNAGYFERAPFFNAVFANNTNVGNVDALNEKVTGFELGYGLRYSKVGMNINLYNTNWKDKSFTTRVQVPSGDEITANVLGVNALHQGAEVEVWYNPLSKLKVRGSFSIGDWRWQNDLTDVPLFDGNVPVDSVDLYIKDVKVGDAAQTTAAVGADYELFPGFSISGDFTYADNLYSQFDPLQRGTAPAEGETNPQALKLPAFGLFDFGFRYSFPVGNMNASLNARMNNAFDTQYIPDALDAPDLEVAKVYYGFGRTWTLGLRFRF